MPKKKEYPKPEPEREETIDDIELDIDCQYVLDALKRRRSIPKKIEILETVIGYLRMEQNRSKLVNTTKDSL